MVNAGVVLSASAQYLGPAVASPFAAASAPEFAMNLPVGEAKIAPGDVLSIVTYGAPELTTTYQVSTANNTGLSASSSVQGIRVGAAGEVELPYLGTVMLAGMQPSEASRYLKNELMKGGFLIDAQITVAVADSPTRVITVTGEVAKPALVSAFGQVRLLDAIAACGGMTPFASHNVLVRRAGQGESISVELGTDPKMAGANNIFLFSGDTIVVPKIGSIFVLGYVKTPSTIPLTNNTPITVLRALAMAGGLNYGAGLSKARIIRTSLDNNREEIRLDLRKIMFGQATDPAMFSNDILLVPANAFKAGMAGGGAGVAAALLYGVSGTASVFK